MKRKGLHVFYFCFVVEIVFLLEDVYLEIIKCFEGSLIHKI